jgi:hypothetical protein
MIQNRSNSKDYPVVLEPLEKPPKAQNLDLLIHGLKSVYKIYLHQGIRDKITHTFDEMGENKYIFNIGKFTKFLCDFD